VAQVKQKKEMITRDKNLVPIGKNTGLTGQVQIGKNHL
jgi:hypothetical protein